MPSFKNIVAVIAALSASVLASDVYAHFYDSAGDMLGPGYDISNQGCFDVSGAQYLEFTQAGGASTADGPYCLMQYTNTGCSGSAANTQQFEDVNLSGTQYALNSNVAGGPAFEWSPAGCPT